LKHGTEGKPGKSHPHIGQEESSLGHGEGNLGLDGSRMDKRRMDGYLGKFILA
jgi:hypothetical protein